MQSQQEKFQIFTTLALSIRRRELIHFKYREQEFWRLVKPCRIGLSKAKCAKLLLQGFQEDGESTSGESRGWKFFEINKIQDVRLTGRLFQFGEHVDVLGGENFQKIYVSIFKADEESL